MAKKFLKIKRSFFHRNKWDSNYRIWSIEIYIPIIGHFINEWLFKKQIATFGYEKGCHWVNYTRRWYRAEGILAGE